MVRILHFTYGMRQVTGITQVLLNYYSAIDKSRIQFDFLALDSRTHPQVVSHIESMGGHVYYIPPFSLLRYRDFIKFIDSFLGDHKGLYTAVHSHCVQLSSIIFKLAKKNGINNCIAHSHSTRLSNNILKNIRNRLMSINIKKYATDYFACSEIAGVYLFGKDIIENNKFFLMRNAIDCNKFSFNQRTRQTIRESLSINDKFVIGHVGRFSREKNHSFLIKIFSEVKKIKDNAVLLLVGEGELEGYIKRIANEYHISDSVMFLGRRFDVDILMQGMDRFVFPSLHEGLGIVLIEAQVAGIPCFVSDKVPLESKISEIVKFISLRESPALWAKQIVADTGERFSGEKLARAKGYDLNIAAQSLTQYYLNLQ